LFKGTIGCEAAAASTGGFSCDADTVVELGCFPHPATIKGTSNRQHTIFFFKIIIPLFIISMNLL
jgi:hypothetical protein